MVLGHLQRGGMPTGYDRLLATRFGGAAAQAVADAKWGHMVALQTPHIVTVPIREAIQVPKRVDRATISSRPPGGWESASGTAEEPAG